MFIVSLKCSDSFSKKQEIIKNNIQACFEQIAYKSYNVNLISQNEYENISTFGSSNSNVRLDKIFKILEEEVRKDKNKYHTIRNVVHSMGPPICNILQTMMHEE